MTRPFAFLASLSLAFLAAGAAFTAGCFSYQSNCDYTLECESTATGTGGNGADGGPPPGCDPAQATGPIGNTCGIFVSPSGDDKNPGSQLLPLKTLSAAVAKGGPIYACQGSTPYTEAVTIAKPVTLYGALDCTKWTALANQKSQLTAPAGMIPLSLSGAAAGTAIHDFTITAADATAAGGSSIAVLDDSAALVLVAVDVAAGKGADGTAGAMPPAQVTTPSTANGGAGVDMSCSVPGTLGGTPGSNMCDGVSVNGGVGGQGVPGTMGSPGTGGNPLSTPSNAGTGQTATTACTSGTTGTQGTTGPVGSGAKGIGEISTSGYTPPVAMMGSGSGGPGQGGGGGGSAKGCTNNSNAGPSGGGGGAGGCGGAAGAPGTSGGSSIGIVLVGATLSMTSVSITTHAGGAGGVGGDGQVGGNGGTAGSAGGSGACGGGPGGQGGIGGGGGGGAGGHSVGIALKGGVVPSLDGAMVAVGVGGAGAGAGNTDTSIVGKGSTGLACKTLDFGNPTSMTACAM